MAWLFGHKKRVDKLRTEVQDSFENVKKDFNKVGEWIKHLDDKHLSHTDDIGGIKNQLLTIHEDLNEIRDFVSFFGTQMRAVPSKQSRTAGDKQGSRADVRTPVRTAVQTDILEDLTVMERGIVWALLNAEMKLSHEDLAALLGKDKSTIRGQINSIKQKRKGLVEEFREANGKKRLFIPEEVASLVVKSVKVRLKGTKNRENSKSES